MSRSNGVAAAVAAPKLKKAANCVYTSVENTRTRNSIGTLNSAKAKTKTSRKQAATAGRMSGSVIETKVRLQPAINQAASSRRASTRLRLASIGGEGWRL